MMQMITDENKQSDINTVDITASLEKKGHSEYSFNFSLLHTSLNRPECKESGKVIKSPFKKETIHYFFKILKEIFTENLAEEIREAPIYCEHIILPLYDAGGVEKSTLTRRALIDLKSITDYKTFGFSFRDNQNAKISNIPWKRASPIDDLSTIFDEYWNLDREAKYKTIFKIEKSCYWDRTKEFLMNTTFCKNLKEPVITSDNFDEYRSLNWEAIYDIIPSVRKYIYWNETYSVSNKERDLETAFFENIYNNIVSFYKILTHLKKEKNESYFIPGISRLDLNIYSFSSGGEV